ncbi:hypothetical protein Taro_000615 [Colocasia esculenta]|uniref:Purple acid phosphatase N-terminal domain-containing protein n=1 Tax=Colocasia esculenta TaxID=4460 RepID=A0A843TDK7_COLES|nr:hypothetical protein [Colocasia esculenta]
MAPTVLYLVLLTVIGTGGGGIAALGAVAGNIPTTMDGPFEPVTVPLDQEAFRGNAVDLPDTDRRVQRKVPGFFPEQISISLSASYDSVWISWVTGEFQIGDHVKPLNPASVKSVVHYGRLRNPLNHEATGNSLVYNQLYPFEGLRNYTSGIIHHVRLTVLRERDRTSLINAVKGTPVSVLHGGLRVEAPVEELGS